MKKRKIKKSIIKKIAIIIIIIILIIVIKNIIGTMKYHKTNEYKLLNKGYNIEEVKNIQSQEESVVNYLLTHEYNATIPKIISEKYYINKNLERYISYLEKNSSKEIKDVISIVNVNADKEWYSDIKKTDDSKGELMLVNKFNNLTEEYKIDSIEIPSKYAYAEKYTSKEMLDNFKEMWNAATKDGMDIIVSSGYRDYKEQEKTYKSSENSKGKTYADKYAARPGHSEHQTGLAYDLFTTSSTTENFEETEEFKWLRDNSYKYGFIMRYPKGKEYLTGYEYEPWHYRYVGKSDAKKIYETGLTFDEYYAYYIEDK